MFFLCKGPEISFFFFSKNKIYYELSLTILINRTTCTKFERGKGKYILHHERNLLIICNFASYSKIIKNKISSIELQRIVYYK